MTTSFPVTRTVTIPGTTTAEVLAAVASTDAFTAINPHRTADPALAIEPFGPPSGIGAGFRFAGRNGKGTQTVAALGPDAVEHAIDMGRMGRSSQRIACVQRAGDVDVTWTQTMLADTFVQRVVGRFAEKILGSTLDVGLANITARLVA